MPKWTKALERQLALLEWMERNDARVWLDLFGMALQWNHSAAAEADPWNASRVIQTQEEIEWTLGYGETYWVSRDMTHLVTEASKSVGNPVLEMHVPFSKTGFVWFEEAIEVWDDAENEALLLQAIAWHDSSNVATYDADGNVVEEWKKGVQLIIFGRSPHFDTTLEWFANPDESDSPESARDLVSKWGVTNFVIPPNKLVVADISAWAEGTVWHQAERGEEAHSFAVAQTITTYRRIIYALWSIMAQKIGSPIPMKGERQYRRRWERRKVQAPDYGTVRLVTLRRTSDRGDHGETEEEWGREWSHRWMVRGHWRNQYYPSEDAHRMIWIEPHVKGPEHLPMVIKDSVFQVSR